MNQKLLSKVIATTLAVMLTFTNFIMLGIYAGKTYAMSDELESQTTVSNNENVKFDAYFVNEEKAKTHKVKQDMDETTKLYLSINVEKGYLKNAKIEAKGEDGKTANFKMLNTDNDFKLVENIDAENNTVKLKQINGGTQLTLDIPVTSIKSELFDLSNFNKINNVKLTGSYVDNAGKTIEIEKTIKIRNEWEKQTKAVIEQETKTYIPYEVGETSGTILQTTIKTGLENNSLPLKQTNINVNVPKVNGKNPEEVIVTLNNKKIDENIKTQTGIQNENDKQIENTINTEAEKQVENKKEIYEYDEKTGILNIIVKNEANEEGKVLWNKDGKDEYIVTYKYNDKVEKIEANQKVEVTIEGYSNEKIETKAENTLNIKENETKGNFVESKIVAENELSKGYLYSKVKKEVEYNEVVELEVIYANLVDKMIIENSVDNFVNTDGELYSTTQNNNKYAYYKKTSINKENFEQILGQDGYIKLIGQDGEEIATFTNKTEADENGNYVYEYEKEVDELKIETSKPIKEGNLKISHVKAIKGKTDYTKKQIEDFQKLQLKTTIKAEYINANIQQTENIKEITLIAPSTKIDVAVNKNNLSTIVKNENVEFRVILKTNDISCDLYKNPKIELILPNYIRDLTIKDVNLLFEDELKIKGRRTYVNGEGNIVIEVELEGEQSVYSQNEVSKGANLIINTDITLKKLTPTMKETVKAYVTNEQATSYEVTNTTKNMARARTKEAQIKAYAENELNAVAPTGMVATTSISGYNSKGETIEAVNEQELVGKLDIRSEARTATVTMNVINNYNNIVNNIKILGRTPIEGNKTAEDSVEEFRSNFTAKPKSAITLEGVESEKYTIYYSAKKDATNDIELQENGWTNSVENIENVASYLIVFNNYNMLTGDIIKFKYDIEIPENLEYNKETYMNYVVYFDNVKLEEIIKDKQIANKVGLSTGEGPNLEVTIRSNIEGNIEEGKLITYTIYAENKGNTAVNNVTLTGTVPDGTIYTRFEGEPGGEDLVTKLQYAGINEYSENVKIISPGETAIATYFVEAKRLVEETTKTIQANAKAVVAGYETEFNAEPVTNQIVEGYLNIDMRISPEYENKREGQSFEYITSIENVNMKPKENVVVTSNVPAGLTFVSANEGGVYNEQTNTVTWNLGTIKGQESKNVILRVTINEMEQGQSLQTISNKMNIKTSEKEIQTNECKIIIEKPILVVNQSSRNNEVSIGDIIEYNVSIQNVGQTDANNIVVEDYLPEGLSYRGSTYIIEGKEYTSWIGSDKATINIPTIKEGQTIDITIKALVDNTENNKNKERTVTNIVGVSADGMKSIGSNEVAIKIVRKAISEDPSVTEPVEGTHKITGLAWKDTNGNGKRDDEEDIFSGIEVMLADANTGKIVQDKVTGMNKTQVTNAYGQYTFSNLEPGKYLVVFLYDTTKYEVTKYKAEGVIDSRNSDVIVMDTTINGETFKAGVANSIEITTQDVTNIDIGLVESKKFDLKLDKVVTKITVNNSKGAKEYTYNDSKFAKLDLEAKTIEGTTIIVEYKIKVTNEGDIAGYVKKIVDNMPNDMKFSSELNKDWYEGESGKLYNSSLANTLLQPGETKEVVLLLTKQMTGNNTGTINNVAEIYEVSNDLGINDIDSTPGNNVQNEDDINNADIVIGVKTGEVYVYMVITFISIAILGIGIYFINKKVLRKI